ncbi:uncharacterized protein LOC119724303 [Patiria miniata]|uniref:Uncharacterized protein n=1 Tax=Patiria miniata TaxID=46514 RepID=A0A913ZJH5_PATMI|nr:uncharacterized protein LOC119724303 [Patiria miniata]
MGQDAMPAGLSGPSFSSDLPPRERVFLRGLYTDVEARLGRVDSGIDALRRRVRDFDGVLDGQIRRCESAEGRVRSLRDDFSRMDREISEMSAELGSNLEAEEDDRQDASEDNMDGELQGADTSVDCNIQVSRSSAADSGAGRVHVTSELGTNSSTELVRTRETLEHGSVTNVTNGDGTTTRAGKHQKTTVSKSSNSIPTQSGHQVAHSRFTNSSQSTGVQDSDSDETHHGIDSCNQQSRNRHQSRNRDNGGISIHQDNNAVSIGVVCNINDPTANGPARPNMASRARSIEGHSRDLSRAEQQLVDLARELNDFRRTISVSNSKMKSDDCLAESPSSRNEGGAVATAQHTEIGQGATGTHQTAVINVNELEHPSIQSTRNISVENRGSRYAEFDRYVEEIIKRHSRETSQNFDESEQTIKVKCNEEEKRRELKHVEPLEQEKSMLSAEGVSDETDSPSDTTQLPETKLNEKDLTSSSTAEGYTTCDEGDSPCVCEHGANVTCQETEATNSNSSTSEGECCHQATESRPRQGCLERLCEQLSSSVETNPCGCCLRDVLATYVRQFLQLLHSRVTQEVKKQSKVKQKVRHQGGSNRGRVTDADISRARDAVFGRLGLTIPMLEVLTEFDHHHQIGSEHRTQVDPAHVTDDEIHRLLVTMGMSWHAMNNHLHDNDCAFRIAIATVHAQMHHVD